MTQRQMSGGGRIKRQKTYTFGRVCVAKGCTTRLSIHNPDHFCARCEKAERMARFETQRLQRLLEEARA